VLFAFFFGYTISQIFLTADCPAATVVLDDDCNFPTGAVTQHNPDTWDEKNAGFPIYSGAGEMRFTSQHAIRSDGEWNPEGDDVYDPNDPSLTDYPPGTPKPVTVSFEFRIDPNQSTAARLKVGTRTSDRGSMESRGLRADVRPNRDGLGLFIGTDSSGLANNGDVLGTLETGGGTTGAGMVSGGFTGNLADNANEYAITVTDSIDFYSILLEGTAGSINGQSVLYSIDLSGQTHKNTDSNPAHNHFWIGSEGGDFHMDNIRVTIPGPPQPLPIAEVTDIFLTDTHIIQFESNLGIDYKLQYLASGTSNVWIDAGSFVIGTGGTMALYDPDGYSASKTYRVLSSSGTDPPPSGTHNGFLDQTATMFTGGTLFNGRAGWGDFNNDGYPDLVDGTQLWQNNAGTGFTKHSTIGGHTFADYNNDGLLDIYVWRHTAEVDVYRNVSGTSFTAFGFPAIDAVNDSQGMAWGDWNTDGDTDLYIGGYLWPSTRRLDVEIANNNGSSFSVDWTESGTIRATRGVTACDFDHDNDLDIFACHYLLEQNYLLVNNGSGTFTDQAQTLGADGFAASNPSWNYAHTIGAAWGDMDNDGDFDIFVANFAHPQNWCGGCARQPESQFLENQGAGGGYMFVDRASTVNLAYQESIGGPSLADYDNDGDLDFWVGVAINTGTGGVDQSPVLYRNDGGWFFTDVTSEAGFGNLGVSLQSAWADIDDDGDLDLVNNGKLFVNQGNSNHWLKVKVDGINQANVGRDAIGTQVRIDLGGGDILVRQVESGTGSHCSNDLVLHFGLGGRVAPVDLEVTWLNGNTQTIQDVAVDQSVLVQ